MKRICIVVLSAAVLFQVPPSRAADDGGWKLKKKSAGIEVYTRDVAGSKLQEFRAVMYVRDTRLSSLVAVFDDTDSYPRWMFNCYEATVLKKAGLRERITYTATDAPWPVWDRDLVAKSFITQDQKTLAVTITVTGIADYIPPREKRIRLPKMNGRWTFTPVEDGSVRVVYQQHNEPGGTVPPGLVNMAVVDLPYNTLLKLREIVKRDEYAKAVYPQIREPKPVR
ncbi:MAG: START domain-containing protein [Spirochaetes bacterium]|nr:START domain-containing protein [Spirochaetota bacterium]